MTAKEKFEDRLKQFGLLNEWKQIGEVGRVATNAEKFGIPGIVLFVHEGDGDNYSEIHYPSIEELRKNDVFLRRCADEWLPERLCEWAFMKDEHEWSFKLRLASWIRRRDGECPLCPVDVYFPAEGMDDYYEDFKDDPDEIMDTSNGHSPSLVAQINEKWDRFRDKFKTVLCALYERDIDEITDSDAFQILSWTSMPQYELGKSKNEWGPYMAMALQDMKERWEDFAENYLMHIADDQDLETIVTFVRFDVCEGTGRDKVLIGTKGPLLQDGTEWHRCMGRPGLIGYLGFDAVTEENTNDRKWWFVGKFQEGELWMNNRDGCCYLASNEAPDIYYARVF